MPTQILINLFIAFLWMFLQDNWNSLSFIAGYLVGIFIIFVIRGFSFKDFYLTRFFAAIKLLLVFIQEAILSGIIVICQITRPRLNLKPGVFIIETDLRGDWEISLLAMLITLTPGSVVLTISRDRSILEVHTMDLYESKEAVINGQLRYEMLIKEVTQ